MADPIDNVLWVPSRKLWANAWNPNVVFNQELRLLEHSIVENGWTQAIIINPDLMVIDGFHRWQLSMTSPALRNEYAEEVPTVTMDLDIPQAMMMTVRMNRAKGTHVGSRMSDLVKILINDYDLGPSDLMEGMGMTSSEVDLLLDGSLIKRRDLKNYKYSKAWEPVETKSLPPEERAKYETEESFQDD